MRRTHFHSFPYPINIPNTLPLPPSVVTQRHPAPHPWPTQVVLQGFLNVHISTWARRLITRTAAIVPAAVLQYLWGDRATYKCVKWCAVLQHCRASEGLGTAGVVMGGAV